MWNLRFGVFIVLYVGVSQVTCDPNQLDQVNNCPVLKEASCPDSKNIQFKLYTKSNPVEHQIVDLATDNLLQTNFDVGIPTKIIIHGFTDNVTSPNHLVIRKQYLKKGAYNLIAVDWSILAAGNLCYSTAIENAKHVGACLAGLVQRLRTAPTEDIHVIGHSLGAHISGFAATTLKPYLLPRITGLDPAGPLFDKSDPDSQLDPTDAKFVDVLHTNINFFGKAKPLGHVDYYFNVDTMNQPGCGLNQICSHFRSMHFFTESINTQKGFYGKQCKSYMPVAMHHCKAVKSGIRMGDNVDPSTRGVVWIKTTSASPFAVGK